MGMCYQSLLILGLVANPLWADVTVKPDALLKAAEFIRNPQEDYQVNTTLVDIKGDKKETRTYETLIKGRNKALVKFLTPIVDKGTKLVMVDDQMWISMPTAAKPIRISARQKLTGNAAYGDIVRLNFTDNYNVKLKGEEKFEGKPVYVLDLTAIDGKPVTYDRVEYWIETKTHKPLKALYMTAAGKTLREGYFRKFTDVLGVPRPTEVQLVDFLERKHVTVLTFTDAKKTDVPDLLFEKQNFGRE